MVIDLKPSRYVRMFLSHDVCLCFSLSYVAFSNYLRRMSDADVFTDGFRMYCCWNQHRLYHHYWMFHFVAVNDVTFGVINSVHLTAVGSVESSG